MSRRALSGLLLVLAMGGATVFAAGIAGLWTGAPRAPAPIANNVDTCTALAIDRATGVTRAVPCAAPAPMLIADRQRPPH